MTASGTDTDGPPTPTHAHAPSNAVNGPVLQWIGARHPELELPAKQ